MVLIPSQRRALHPHHLRTTTTTIIIITTTTGEVHSIITTMEEVHPTIMTEEPHFITEMAGPYTMAEGYE